MASIKKHYIYQDDPTYHVYELTFFQDNRTVLFIVPIRYSIIKYIGGGAFGNVCSAKDNVTYTFVAIKQINISNNVQYLEDTITVFNEISVMRSFTFRRDDKKTNILSLYSIVSPPKNNNKDNFSEVYLVTKLYDMNLSACILSNALQITQQKFIMYNILIGLKQLHDKQILHGDLKPSNIYCNVNCDTVLGDLGLSQRFSTEKYKSATKLRNYIITRWYRPPEILLINDSKYDEKVDIWSAGCIFMELFTGKPVFKGRDSIEQYIIISRYLGSSPQIIEIAPRIKSKFKNAYMNIEIYSMKRKLESLKSLIPRKCWDNELFDLLLGMIDTNPLTRKSATELLKYPYFSDFYDDSDLHVPISPFKYNNNYPYAIEYENMDMWTIKEIRNSLWYEMTTNGFSHFGIDPTNLNIEETTQRNNIANNALHIFDCINQKIDIVYNIVYNFQLHAIDIYDKYVSQIYYRIHPNNPIIIFKMNNCIYNLLKSIYSKYYTIDRISLYFIE